MSFDVLVSELIKAALTGESLATPHVYLIQYDATSCKYSARLPGNRSSSEVGEGHSFYSAIDDLDKKLVQQKLPESIILHDLAPRIEVSRIRVEVK